MDDLRSICSEIGSPEELKIESALAGAAVGGLIGLMFGPIGTLICVVIGAGIGCVTSWRQHQLARRVRADALQLRPAQQGSPDHLL
jgi:outer membrane lipoprotein SlyB